jgi:predicted enzyme related to lactoylglutathione lyase
MDLNSIMIGSDNSDRLKEYYTKLFGKPAYEDPGYGFSSWQIGTGWLSVGPHDQVKGKNTSPGRILWNIETPDVKSEFERLKEAGAAVVQEPYNPGGPDMPDAWVCTFADPDDNYFQLMSPMTDM